MYNFLTSRLTVLANSIHHGLNIKLTNNQFLLLNILQVIFRSSFYFLLSGSNSSSIEHQSNLDCVGGMSISTVENKLFVRDVYLVF